MKLTTLLLLLLTLTCLTAQAAPTIVTNSFAITYSDPGIPNSAFTVNSDVYRVRVCRPMTVTGMPANGVVSPGTTLTLAVTVDGAGPDQPNQEVYAPTFNGTYVQNSLVVTGTTGKVNASYPDHMLFGIAPLAESLPVFQPVKLAYSLKF